MDGFEDIPKRRPKGIGLGRVIPFLIIGYVLLTSFFSSFRLPATGSVDPITSLLLSAVILVGAAIFVVIIIVSYILYSK